MHVYPNYYYYIKKLLHHTIIKKKEICSLNMRMVNQGLNLSLKEWRLIAEHRNISDYEHKYVKDLINHLEDQDQGLELKRIS